MKKFIDYMRVIAHAFEMSTRQNFMDAFILFGILVQPLLIAVLAFWMLSEKGGDYVTFVVVGAGMTGLWTAVLFDSGNAITAERWTGTLELLIGSPTPLQITVFGKNLANVVLSLLSMVVCFSIAIMIFGYIPEIKQPHWFGVSIVLGVISYVFFGLVLSPLFVLNPDVQRWQNGLEFPIYVLCGFLFPIALLPNWTTPFSYILAPYWAARALHASSSGGDFVSDILLSWVMMVVFIFLYGIISALLFKSLLRKARADATLGIQ